MNGLDRLSAAVALGSLADILESKEELTEAEVLSRRALAIDESAGGLKPSEVLVQLSTSTHQPHNAGLWWF